MSLSDHHETFPKSRAARNELRSTLNRYRQDKSQSVVATETVERLAKELCDGDKLLIYQRVENDKTIMHVAARNDDDDLLDALLNSLEQDSRTKLILMDGKFQWYSYLLPHKRVETCIHTAIRHGNQEVAEKIIGHLKDNPASQVQLLSMRDDRGRTPIDLASGPLETLLKDKLNQKELKEGWCK